MKIPNLDNVHVIFHHKLPQYIHSLDPAELGLESDYPFISIKHKGYTICQIYRGEELVGEGRADCSLEDQFVRPLGRAIACDRALGVAAIGDREENEIRKFVISLPSSKRYFKNILQ